MEMNSNKNDFLKKRVIFSALLSFVDVAIIVLIFFLSVAKFSLNRSSKNILPARPSIKRGLIKPVAIKKEREATLTLDSNKKLFFDGKEISISSIKGSLSNFKNFKIKVKKDKGLSMSFVTKVVSEIKSSGITDILVENI